MNTSEALKRISSANGALAQAIASLIAFESAPAYLDALTHAADLLQGISLDSVNASERAALAQETELLRSRNTQAENLFQSAGALQFGSFLNNSRVGGGYTPAGDMDYSASGGFHIDG
jgi:hypothetical protein